MIDRGIGSSDRTVTQRPVQPIQSVTGSQWDRIERLVEQLGTLPMQRQKSWIDHLFQQGEDPVVLSLVTCKLRLPPENESCRVGSKIREFTLKRQIGIGGMGVAYLAEQDSPRRQVIVKVIHSFWAGDLRFSERFREEIEILGRLDHAWIAQIYAGGIHTIRAEGRERAFPFYAMQYVRGTPITAYAVDVELELEERVNLLVKVCDAVTYAHTHNIVHTDLKPDHILIDADGNPHLLDFGLAIRIDSSLPRGANEVGFGTPAYMSPEQTSAAYGDVGPWSDVYALGVILYELLTGKRPYTSVHDVLRGTSVPKIGELNSECDGDLENVVAKAMEKKSDDRFRTVAAFQEALKRISVQSDESQNLRLAVCYDNKINRVFEVNCPSDTQWGVFCNAHCSLFSTPAEPEDYLVVDVRRKRVLRPRIVGDVGKATVALVHKSDSLAQLPLDFLSVIVLMAFERRGGG